jgi:hypothetical protein
VDDKLKDITSGMPTTIRCVSENKIKSRGLFLYEIRNLQTYDQKNETISRKDIMYLAISWQLNMNMKVPENERCLFSVIVLRTNHPTISKSFVLQRLFDKMMELTLAQQIENWCYTLSDGVRFTLHSDIKYDASLSFQPNGEDLTFEPVKVSICIDSLRPEDFVSPGPSLFLPAYGYQ